MKSKKALGSVIATSLLIVVAVFTMALFSSWFSSYSSNLFSDVETQSSINEIPEIETVIEDFVYIKTSINMTIDRLLINGNECLTNISLQQGIEKVNISSCLNDISAQTIKITLITDNNIVTESVYLKNILVESNSTSSSILIIDSNCYDPANIGSLGLWEGCNGMLIVNRIMLDNAISMNGGEDFYIEYSGINYTFGDSEFNIFTGQVTDMNSLFQGESNFNSNINYWDVSNVINMQNMFLGASSFNQSLDWNTSSVTTMQAMFYNAINLNQPLIFDTRNVETMRNMFVGASSFNQPLDWNTSSVTTMLSMFSGASSFNGNINSWDVSKVITMESMFRDAISFNQSLNWDTSNVKIMWNMFLGASSFNQPLIFNTHNVTNMISMFRDAISFNQPLNWNTSSVTSMSSMFSGADNFNGNISNWDVRSVINMHSIFYQAYKFNQSLNNWNVSSVQIMQNMFHFAYNFNQPLNSWDVSSVTDMTYMFKDARDFNQTLSSWCVSQILLEPSGFDDWTSDWNPKAGRQPVWGSCP